MKRTTQSSLKTDSYQNQLTALKGALDDAYDDLLHQMRATLGQNGRPLLVIVGDEAALIHDGGTETAVITPPLYQRLTILNHVAPGLLLTLAANGPGPLNSPCRAHLERQLDLITNALHSLDEQRPPGPYHQHQQQVLEQAQTLINVTLISGLVEESRLHAYEAANATLQQENAFFSAAVFLETLQAITNRWRKQLDPATWDRLRVIIAAAAPTRHLDASRIYFQHLLQQPPGDPADPETHLIYAADIATLEQALDHLAYPLIARRAAGLGDRGVEAQRDQLAGAAQGILTDDLQS